MADMMDTLRGLLGDNADEKLKNIMTTLQSSGLMQNTPSAPQKKAGNLAKEINDDIKIEAPAKSTPAQSGSSSSGLSAENLQYMAQIKNIINEMSNSNDSRSNLLRSLRPYMRTNRQVSIDRAIRLMNLSKLSGLAGLFRK
ncbi:MAG: hypothetical protein PUB42_00185 [Firmicutes bacterium]|nr:hypothetical protein [Bacillota bacterium]